MSDENTLQCEDGTEINKYHVNILFRPTVVSPPRYYDAAGKCHILQVGDVIEYTQDKGWSGWENVCGPVKKITDNTIKVADSRGLRTVRMNQRLRLRPQWANNLVKYVRSAAEQRVVDEQQRAQVERQNKINQTYYAALALAQGEQYRTRAVETAKAEAYEEAKRQILDKHSAEVTMLADILADDKVAEVEATYPCERMWITGARIVDGREPSSLTEYGFKTEEEAIDWAIHLSEDGGCPVDADLGHLYYEITVQGPIYR